MNDEATVALMAGGPNFGKTHGRAMRAARAGVPIEHMGARLEGSYGFSVGAVPIISGLKVPWTYSPTK